MVLGLREVHGNVTQVLPRPCKGQASETGRLSGRRAVQPELTLWACGGSLQLCLRGGVDSDGREQGRQRGAWQVGKTDLMAGRRWKEWGEPPGATEGGQVKNKLHPISQFMLVFTCFLCILNVFLSH